MDFSYNGEYHSNYFVLNMKYLTIVFFLFLFLFNWSFRLDRYSFPLSQCQTLDRMKVFLA